MSQMLPPFAELRAGRGCPLCTPRPDVSEHTFLVCKLSVSSLYVLRNQAYRGSCAVMYDAAHATRPSELELQAWRELCSDVWLVERAVTRVFQPDHVNLETLGNTVPHLHTAIIPRYRSDPRWGHPIWMTQRQDMPQVPISDLECERLAQVLRPELSY